MQMVAECIFTSISHGFSRSSTRTSNPRSSNELRAWGTSAARLMIVSTTIALIRCHILPSFIPTITIIRSSFEIIQLLPSLRKCSRSVDKGNLHPGPIPSYIKKWPLYSSMNIIREFTK